MLPSIYSFPLPVLTLPVFPLPVLTLPVFLLPVLALPVLLSSFLALGILFLPVLHFLFLNSLFLLILLVIALHVLVLSLLPVFTSVFCVAGGVLHSTVPLSGAGDSLLQRHHPPWSQTGHPLLPQAWLLQAHQGQGQCELTKVEVKGQPVLNWPRPRSATAKSQAEICQWIIDVIYVFNSFCLSWCAIYKCSVHARVRQRN